MVNSDAAICGFVHVSDAVRATTGGGQPHRAADLMTEPLRLPAETPVATAIRLMREGRSQLAVVEQDSHPVGVVALEDLLEEVIGEFDDETDPIITAARETTSGG